MDTVKVDPSENDVTIQPQLHRPYASVISVGATSSSTSTTPTLPSSSSTTSLNHRHLTKSSPFVHGSNNRSTLSDAAVNNSEKKFQPSGSSLVGEGGIPLHRPYLPARLTHTGVSSRSGRFFHQKAADVYWNMYLKTVNQPPSAAAPIACSSTSLPEPNCAKKTSPSPLQQQQVYNSGSSTSSTNPTDQTTTLSISTAGVSRETVPPLTRNERADLKDGSHYPLAHLLSPPHLSGVSSNYRRQPRVVQEQQPLNLRTYREDPPTSRSADQQQQPIPHISEYPGVGPIGFTGPLLMSIATLIDAGFNTNALLENKSAAATCTPLQSNPQDPTAIAASSSKQSRPKMVENEAQSSSPPNKNNAKPVYEFLSPPHPSTVSIDCHPNGGQNLALKQPLNLGNYIKDPPLPLMSPSVDQQQPIPHISEYPSVGPIGFTGPLPMSVATLIDARFNSNAIRPTLEDKSVAAAYALLLLQSNPQGPSASSSKQSRSSIVKDDTHSSLPPNKNSAKPVHKLKTAWFQRHTGNFFPFN